MLPEQFRAPSPPRASRPHMPGYGILGANSGQGLLPWSWATERLSRARTYWLSTTRPDHRPHAMPIWGVWLASVFCFSTGQLSRKARNLEGNPDCVVGVTTSDDSIALEGVARLADDAHVRRVFSATYSEKYQWNMEDFSDPIYVVWPVVTYGFSSAVGEFSGSATRWTFATTQWNRKL